MWKIMEKFISIKLPFHMQELECPYIQGVDDSWIEELLFKPGEPRIRLLQWLLGRLEQNPGGGGGGLPYLT